MNKILYVSNTANFSKFNKPFMKWTKEQGWQVDYCAPNDDVITDCDKHIVLPIPRSPFSKGILRCIKELRIILNKEQYNIIHCHTPMGGVIARLAARKLYKKGKVKIIYTAHGFHFYKGAPFFNWILYYPIEKFMLKYTSALVTINKEDYELAKKKFKKITDVRFMNGVGVDLKKFSPINTEENIKIRKSLGYSSDDFLITVVAELNKNKNQGFLIRQLPEINKIIPNLKVLFLGRESEGDARKIATEMNLMNICQFLGYRKDVDLFEKISDMCFSSSIREGLPVNIIEGLACGKLCICSENRGHNSLIENGKNGFLFNLNNSEDMILLIKKVYNHHDLLKTISINAINDAKQYDISNAISFTSELYTSLLVN